MYVIIFSPIKNQFHEAGNLLVRLRATICVTFLCFVFSCQLALADSNKSLVLLVKKIKPAIVSIELFNSQQELFGQATGFIMSPDGLVVTNWHVISKASSAYVKTFAGTKFEVKGVIGEDPLRDLAIIAIKSEKADFPFLKLLSRKPDQGEQIVVMGNPLGQEFTLSDGLISAIRSYSGLLEIIQISAPISPGSSGSPIMDLKGEVLAIVSGGWAEGQNLNFGISSTHIDHLYQKTQRNIASAKSLNPSDKLEVYLQARILTQDGFKHLTAKKYSEALSIADQVVRLIPELLNGYLLRSLSYQGLEQYDNALIAINKAIEKDPEEPSLYNNRAYVWTRLRKFERALKDCDKAILIYPETASFYHTRSNVFSEMGDSNSALQDINRAIALSPSEADFYMSRVKYYTDLGNTSKAIADLRKALRLYPDRRDQLFVQGSLYTLQGEKGKAIESFKQAARLGHKTSILLLEQMGLRW